MNYQQTSCLISKCPKKKIIITELINSQFHTYEKTALKVSDFIKSANKQMEEHGYTIISSDTNGLG